VVSVAAIVVSCFGVYSSVFGQNVQSQDASRDIIQNLPPKEKRFAVVIGVDQYDSSDISSLRGSSNDANELKKALVAYAGFPEDQVYVLASSEPKERQPTRANIINRLAKLRNVIPSDGLLLVSFSGHGIENGGKGYLLPSDASSVNDVETLKLTALSATTALDLVRATGVRQVLVLLDACRNDPEGGRGFSGNSMTDAFKREFTFDTRNKGINAFVTLYATGVGSRAYESSERKQGYFSLSVVEALSGKAADPATGEITLERLINYVETNVPKLVAANSGPGREQKPFAVIEGYRANKLVIAVSRVTAPPPTPAPSAETKPEVRKGDEAFWNLIKDQTNCDGFNEYLKAFPKGEYVHAAKYSLRTCKTSSSSDEPPEQPSLAKSEQGNQSQNVPTNSGAESQPKKVEVDDKTTAALPPIAEPIAATDSPTAALEKNKVSSEVATTPGPGISNPTVIVKKPNFPTTPPKSSFQMEKEAWDRVRISKVPTELRKFLADFSSSQFTISAKTLLHNIVWKNAQTVNTISLYEEYLTEFPKGAYARQARAKIARLTKSAPKVDEKLAADKAWEAIKDKDDVARLNLFIEQFPSSVHTPVASEKVRELQEHAAQSHLVYLLERILESGDASAAVRQATDFYSSDPNNFLALNARAIAYLSLGRLKESQEDSERIVSLISNPSSILEFETLANAHLRLGRSELVSKICDQGLRLFPDNPKLLLVRGSNYLKDGNVDLGIRDLEEVVNRDPSNVQGYSLLANALFSKGQTERAQFLIDRLQTSLHFKPRAFYERAKFFSKANDNSKALQSANTAISMNPQLVEAMLLRSRTYEALGNLVLAQEDLDQAINIGRDRVDVHFARAQFHARRKENDKAISDLISTLSLDPYHVEAMRMRAKLYFETEQLDKARADFSKLLEFVAEDAEALVYQARMASDVSMRAELIARALQSDGKYADAYVVRGQMSAEAKKFADSISDYDRAFELGSKNVRLFEYRAVARFLQKEFSLAATDITKTIELFPDRLELFAFRSELYKKVGLKDQAKADKKLAGKVEDFQVERNAILIPKK